MIAVLAGLLAISTLLSNEAVKETINNQTRAAFASALAETNAIKAFIGTSTARQLRLLAGTETSPREAPSPAPRRAIGRPGRPDLRPARACANRRAAALEATHVDEDDKHFRFEFASAALEIGIVLGSVAIITHLRWLVGGGILAGVVGIAFTVAGLLV
jgi:hypothetical protein